jgi:uncharacterized protein
MPVNATITIPTQRWHRQWAMWTHVSIVLMLLLLPVVPPLVLWLVRRKEHAFIDDHGREAMNVQLSVIAYIVLGSVLGPLTCGIGFILYVAAVGLALWACAGGAQAAARGQLYRAPITLRLIAAPVLSDSAIAPV